MLTTIPDRLILVTDRLEVFIDDVNLLIYRGHRDDARRVVKEIDKRRVPIVTVFLWPRSRERCQWCDERIDRTSGPGEVLGAVPVLHVLLLIFSFRKIGFRNLACRHFSKGFLSICVGNLCRYGFAGKSKSRVNVGTTIVDPSG